MWGCAPRPLATHHLCRSVLCEQTEHRQWSTIGSEDVKGWLALLLDRRYSDSYVNNQHRALQQFLRWYADEEELPTRWRR